ncbi:hypothetical protein [Arthrobacter mobilis]|uniref:Uncharacterized protein n=1 Tax=Arthrobacter mobilis TaxID=2724944 RepID=A0A7X6HGL7_9MICC|nr:hypothetical protein [Arthrobacter mobilis]NKX56010.1 hypothetical protein [Arthrobacter mobilis]
MARKRSKEPHPLLAEAAKELIDQDIRRLVVRQAAVLAPKLGRSEAMTAAALADVLETGALRELTEQLTLDLEESVDSGIIALRQDLADLIGTTRSNLELRYKDARAARKPAGNA